VAAASDGVCGIERFRSGAGILVGVVRGWMVLLLALPIWARALRVMLVDRLLEEILGLDPQR